MTLYNEHSLIGNTLEAQNEKSNYNNI